MVGHSVGVAYLGFVTGITVKRKFIKSGSRLRHGHAGCTKATGGKRPFVYVHPTYKAVCIQSSGIQFN